jgi:hypothetical protein
MGSLSKVFTLENNIRAFNKPKIGDCWTEMFCPYYLVLDVYDEVILVLPYQHCSDGYRKIDTEKYLIYSQLDVRTKVLYSSDYRKDVNGEIKPNEPVFCADVLNTEKHVKLANDLRNEIYDSVKLREDIDYRIKLKREQLQYCEPEDIYRTAKALHYFCDNGAVFGVRVPISHSLVKDTTVFVPIINVINITRNALDTQRDGVTFLENDIEKFLAHKEFEHYINSNCLILQDNG